MASEDVKRSESAVSTIVNLAEEAKPAREGVKAPSFAVLSICKSLVAGGVACGVSRTAVASLELLKILLQVQNPHSIKYKGTIQGLKYIWRTEGFRGLFKGNGSNCAHIVPNSAVKFFSYEQASRRCSTHSSLASWGWRLCWNNCNVSNLPKDMVRGRLTVQNFRYCTYPNIHVRKLTMETYGGNNGSKDIKFNHNEELLNPAHCQYITEIAKEVCKVIRSKTRWEQTLLSDYPSFNFHDPSFFRELLKQLNNVLLSFRFFLWLSSHHQFLPHPPSCNTLFDALVEAKACIAAKYFLHSFSFSPEPASLEGYIRCLCEGGLVEEVVDVFDVLKKAGYCPSIETLNFALQSCLKVGRTDLIWKLYEEMMESGVLADVSVETVGYLIQAFCEDKKVLSAYELLRQALEDGLAPDNDAFKNLISGFCEEGNYDRVSELLHTMIAKNRNPDIFMYQEIINGLCKKMKQFEAFRVFNDLKDRGYAPDMVMYTTMIHGFCKRSWLGNARKLWFEMIEKGYIPNVYTYNALIYGFCKTGNLDEAQKLYKEMLDRGYKETTLSCNTVIAGLCKHGRTEEAYDLFQEMPGKDIVCDVVTFNTLIQGFCREGKISMEETQ